MSTLIEATDIELQLAWNRLKADRPNRCFVEHPHLIRWVEHDLPGWLAQLKADLAEGYNPQPAQLCLAPKPGFMLRPALVLELRDEVVFNLIVGRLYPVIAQRLAHLQGDPDVACQITNNAESVEWIRSGFRVWNQWRLRSLEKLTADTTHVLVADIAGFYDNMDYARLQDNLRRMDAPATELRLLAECLNRWTHPRGKGVPQGYGASDILAKTYLWSFDERLVRNGYTHLRYVDDIRIFCSSKYEAKKAAVQISKLLHVHGLTIQSSKTKILSSLDARATFDGVQPIIQQVQHQLAREIQEELGLITGYMRAGELSRILDARGGEIHPRVLERTFGEYFSASGDVKFDKTLFHYLLTRLAKVESGIAVDFCTDALRTRPEETEYILRYFAAITLAPDQYAKITECLHSAEPLYDFQAYQIVLWHLQQERSTDSVLALARQWALDRNKPQWLRSVCIAYTGRFAQGPDLDLLEESYAEATNDVERADIVAALTRQERGRRNTFYARLRRDGDLIQRAIAVARM